MKEPKVNEYNLTPLSLKKYEKKRRLFFEGDGLISPIGMHISALIGAVVLPMMSEDANILVIFSGYALGGCIGLMGLSFFIGYPLEFIYGLLNPNYKSFLQYHNVNKEYQAWLLRTQLAFWDNLTGRQFEREVANLFKRSGISSELTPASNDKGVDIVLADGTLVQCKAHKNPISPAVARELYGTIKHFRAPKGILIAKNGFTKGVFGFVSGKPITLMDVNGLIALQKEYGESR